MASTTQYTHNQTLKQGLTEQFVMVTLENNGVYTQKQRDIIVNKIQHGKKLSIFTIAEGWQNCISHQGPSSMDHFLQKRYSPRNKNDILYGRGFLASLASFPNKSE